MNYKSRISLLLKVVLLSLVMGMGYAPSGYSQSPYMLDLKKDLPIMVGSTGGLTAGYLLQRNKTLLTPQEIQGLDRKTINWFDRPATFNWSKSARTASDIFLYGSHALPFLLLTDKSIRQDWKKVGFIGIETYLLNASLTMLTKQLAKRKRPFVYNHDVPMEYKVDKGATESFFSGHTSASATLSFMTATIFSHYHPNSKLRPYVWTLAALIPAITGYLRIRAGKHFPTDIIVGYALGASIGILIPSLHLR